MKVAIPIFGARVSPRFDCAQDFLVVTLQDGVPSEREQLSASGWAPHERVNRLLQQGVDTVVCGGIDCWSAESLQSAGVRIYARVTGEIEDVLAGLARGELEPQAMAEAGGPGGCRQLTGAADKGTGSSGSRRGMGRRGGRGRGGFGNG